VQLLLEGRQTDLSKSLRARMHQAAEAEEYERAARYRDLLSTVDQLHEKQRMAAAEGDDTDVFGYHFENDMAAVNVFHMRGGKVLDRREFFWEELPDSQVSQPSHELGAQPPPAESLNATPAGEGASTSARAKPARSGDPGACAPAPRKEETSFNPGEFFSALLKQVYIDQQYVPRTILVPADFEDREALEELLTEKRNRKVEILSPQRGEKRSLIDLAAQNAKQSFDQRFRIMKPAAKAVREALQEALGLPELPKRIECFDISHIQGAETVASMVVWEEGKMNKSEYRKFIVRTVSGVDDFAAMREVVFRRYKRLLDESPTKDAGAQPPPAADVRIETAGESALAPNALKKSSASLKNFPSLILVDGGLGQLHAATAALEELEITNQPVAAIAKKEEVIYVAGQESEPVVLDRHSPVLHLVQMIRDESHRFAVTFHRKRRQMRDRASELLEIPGIGQRTRQRLLQHFGSVRAIQQADSAALGAVLTRSQTEAVLKHFQRSPTSQ
jgi:excinuclease ABC subunit C